jgi:hypothetical protein
MARRYFLSNFRIARNLFVHPQIETDSPHSDPHALEQKLARAAIWLTPRSVKGINAAEFPELGPDRQRELQTAVQDFLEVANQVPATKPATTEQYRDAAVAFRKLLDILNPYLPTADENKRVEKALRSVEFPPWVVNWDYEMALDAEESPILWVTLFADEHVASPEEYARDATPLTRTIRQALTAAEVSRWPYVRVQTAAEHKSM